MRVGPSLASSLVAAIAALTLGCSRGDEAAGTMADTATGDAPAAEAGAAMATPYAGHDYACADGVSFHARIDQGNAIVTLEGKTYTLAPAASGSAGYEGEGLTFVPRGSEATLVRPDQAAQTCTTS